MILNLKLVLHCGGKTMTEKQKGLFRRLWDKYSEFCKELGIDQGACRSCVPMVKFDEDPPKKEKEADK